MTLALLLICGLLLVIVALGQYRTYVVQYLWFCRFPLLIGLVLLALPILANRVAPSMFRNLLVLDAVGMGQVSFWATLAAWTVMFSLALIFEGTRYRCGLPFERPNEEKVDPPGPLRVVVDLVERALLATRDFLVSSSEGWREIRALVFFALLALPTLLVAVEASIGEAALWRLVGTAVGGPVLAWLFRVQFIEENVDDISSVFFDRVESPEREGRIRGWVPVSLRRGLPWFDRDAPPDLVASQARAFWFFVLVLVLYAIGYAAQKPISPNQPEVPALGFVLVLLIMACMALSFLSYFLDLYRVPVTAVVVGLSFVGFWWADRDHYYEMIPVQDAAYVEPVDPIDVYEAWRARNPDRPLVVVAASGGGITASFWTARILTGLQADTDGRFGESIALLSTVSGGSVGGMFFVDRYRPEGPPVRRATLDSILDMSGRSSLAATAWGLVYPDFWRTFGWTRARLDRGWATEQPWRQRLMGPDTMLLDWRRGVVEGWRPVQVFNATIVESGERLAISPMRLSPRDSVSRGARDFFDLYRGDVPVTTAARLSATFPFVTPVARPPEGIAEDAEEYHLADGGYYDNFGIVSAIDFLEHVLPRYREDGGERVVFLKILLSDFEPGEARGRRGWVYSALGPLLTMMSVRTSAQMARNDLEIRLFKRRWEREGLAVDVVEFILNDPGAPLSWHLTWKEKCRIDSIWWSSEAVHEGRTHVGGLLGAGRTPVRRSLDCRR